LAGSSPDLTGSHGAAAPVTDTEGFLIGLILHEANLQDRDGAPFVLKSILRSHPWLRHVFADAGYTAENLKGALKKIGRFVLDIARRKPRTKSFEVLPRRWGGRTHLRMALPQSTPRKGSRNPSDQPKLGSSSPRSASSRKLARA
jgi:transposase